MPDPAVGAVVGTLLKMAISLAAEEISLAWGAKDDLTKLAEELETIQAQLSDAQSKQMTDKRVELWLERLGSVALDIQIVLDEFGYQVLSQKIDKVRHFFSSSNPLIYRLRMPHEIEGVMKSLRGVYAHSTEIGLRGGAIGSTPYRGEQRSTDPFVDDSEIVGRDDDTSKLINMLVDSDYRGELPVIAIQGMGGAGKTTLAQLVFKNDEVQSYFDKSVWVCVSEDSNIERLLTEMLQFLTETNHQLTNAWALVGKLKKELSGKRYLLVLDDVWDENGLNWNRMRGHLLNIGGSNGSKILITTRSEEVVAAMRTPESQSQSHQLQELSEQKSWELFEKWAFADGGAKKSDKMEKIGKSILKRCGGVPLAIRVIGGLLYKNNSELEWEMIERSQLWRNWNEVTVVSEVIKLSYYHLPSLSLKQCFAYCAIFHKDQWIGKDDLIRLWMAQGLLNPPDGSGLEMEDIGNDYFNSLLRRSLLQDIRKDRYNNITHCKMHDLVHDVSLEVSKNYCFHVKDWKDVKDKIRAVHLSILATAEEGLPKSWKGTVPSKLRTLHWKGRCYMLEDVFANCKYLTVLILKDRFITELPNSISEIKHLRFFDISNCREITRLPKSFTELYYLQTLKVCVLDEVPKGFWKLINLRHFYGGFSKSSLIPRLSKLTNLRTLPSYHVDKCNGCQIEELEHLSNLTGELRIYCLQNVSTKKSAMKSNLSRKSKVQTLYLHWDDKREEDCDDSGVMEGLKPHSNLKSLTIDGYQSPRFPSWMTARDELGGNHLVKLILEKLKRCEQLPSLGVLPCLEHLEISGLDSVRRIGEEFYGWSNLDWAKESNSSNSSQITLFPSLKVFKLLWMKNLEKWSDAIVPAHAHSSSSVEVFPVLEEMELHRLPELCSFPNLGCLPKLRRLSMWGCLRLTTLPSNWNGVGTHQKSEFKDERAASAHDSCVVSSSVGVGPSSSYCRPHDDLLAVNVPNVHYLPSLRHVSLLHCDKFAAPFCSLKILAPLESLVLRFNQIWPKDLRHHLSNLISLELGGCSEEEVDCFPFPFSISNVTEDVQCFASLTALTLCGRSLGNVKSLSDQIQYLTSLRDLTIREFARLVALPEGLGNLTSLQKLTVCSCPNLKQLPHQIQYLTSLRDLRIQCLDRLEALPEWLGNLTSLQNLRVSYCPNLKQLPSAEAFQRLTNLQRLEIVGCGNLEEACTPGSGSEWPKIALIPNLQITLGGDGVNLLELIGTEEF